MSAEEKLRVYQNACRDHSVPSAVVHRLHEAYLAEVRSSPVVLNGNVAVAILEIVFQAVEDDCDCNGMLLLGFKLEQAGYTRELLERARG